MRARGLAKSALAPRALATRFAAVIFDKDGTLLDYAATWDVATAAAIVASLGLVIPHWARRCLGWFVSQAGVPCMAAMDMPPRSGMPGGVRD